MSGPGVGSGYAIAHRRMRVIGDRRVAAEDRLKDDVHHAETVFKHLDDSLNDRHWGETNPSPTLRMRIESALELAKLELDAAKSKLHKAELRHNRETGYKAS